MLLLIDSLTAGGAEMLLAEFAAAASADRLRISVAYLSDRERSTAATRLRQAGVEPVALGLRGLVHPATLSSVRRHIASVRPDLVHTHLDYADLIGGLAARSLGVPSISTVHVMQWPATTLRDRVRRRLITFVRRHTAAALVAVSDAAREGMVAAKLAKPSRIFTIHNGVAARREPGAGKRIRAQLGIGSDVFVIAQVAVLRAGKGHGVASAAVGRLRERYDGLRFLIVGDGPDRRLVRREVEALGETAMMLGHRDDVMAILDSADVVVAPSLIDAFPTALIEGMAAGAPVVASAVGGIPEIVADGETGLLVSDPTDVDGLTTALERLIVDPSLRSRLGRAGRARYEREFTAQLWATRTCALYRAVLADGAQGRTG